ncbi:MAG: 4Fe-4S binding protein [Actinomycetota bacterium]
MAIEKAELQQTPLPTRKEQMLERFKEIEKKIAERKVLGPVYGLAKGLSVTLRTMSKRSITRQYPHVMPELPPRTRGVIALKEENCTVCMLCSRECPDWCIYIDSHKDVMPPKTPGARPRTRNVLDRFAIDYALCMYCGICVEVCPFDALFWAPNFEYSETDITKLTHEMPTLGEWMAYVEPPPELEAGADPEPEREKEAKVFDASGAVAAVSAAPAAAALAPPAAPSEASSEATAAPAPPAPAAPAVEKDHTPPEIDQETFDREIAAGKSEREARAIAKKAWIIKRRKAQEGAS